jgi:hypothetical protein
VCLKYIIVAPSEQNETENCLKNVPKHTALLIIHNANVILKTKSRQKSDLIFCALVESVLGSKNNSGWATKNV